MLDTLSINSEVKMKKDVLVIGGGGREHAICLALKNSKDIGKIYCVPGNAGIAQIATCFDIPATDCEKILQLAKEIKPYLVFVAPDDPLSLGLVNMLENAGIMAFGPTKEAAIIEASKKFSKDFMSRHNIPTAKYMTFSDFALAMTYLDSATFPLVVKADGLALGKGVIICQNIIEAQKALTDIMQEKVFGKAGSEVVIEEFLIGKEITLLAFTDGTAVKLMPASQDHKRAFDNDLGQNTGGMGAFAPTPTFTKALENEVLKTIVYPTINGLRKENKKFKGVIYFGLMACPSGVKVIEYNARLGDPETQVILPLLESDFLAIVEAVIKEKLDNLDIKWSQKSALTVVLASANYPGKIIKGKEIVIGALSNNVTLFHSGTANINGKLVTSGGRVMCLGALGNNLAEARTKVYAEIDKIQFEGMRYRSDIGNNS